MMERGIVILLSMRLLNLLSPKIGASLDTLHYWLRPHERDTGGGDGGLTTTERQRLKEWCAGIASGDVAITFCAKPQFILRRWSSAVCGKNNVAAGYPQR